MAEQFPIRLAGLGRPAAILWGATPSRAWATLNGDLVIRYGFFRLSIPVANLARWRIEGPFRWITAMGVRRSLTGGDISFWGGAPGGVRIDLREPVRWGPLRIPAVYVGAGELERFAAALERRGIPGEDARRR